MLRQTRRLHHAADLQSTLFLDKATNSLEQLRGELGEEKVSPNITKRKPWGKNSPRNTTDTASTPA